MKELISNHYIDMNKSLHSDGNFGVSGYKWAPSVSWIVAHHGINHVLDYGAGQQTLKKSLSHQTNLKIDCYDPAIPELSRIPVPAELLTCTDVLEHIEPTNIDHVLDHINSLFTKYVFW